jgi:hypothetical protein
MAKAQGYPIEGLIDEPQAARHHRIDGFAGCEAARLWVLLHGLINDVATAEFVEHGGDKAKVVQHLTAVWGCAHMTISFKGRFYRTKSRVQKRHKSNEVMRKDGTIHLNTTISIHNTDLQEPIIIHSVQDYGKTVS